MMKGHTTPSHHCPTFRSTPPMTRHQRQVGVVILGTIVLLATALILTWSIGNAQAAHRHQQAFTTAAAAITSACARTTQALEAIAATSQAAATVTGGLDPDHPAVLDMLQVARTLIDAEIVYLMDPEGLTVACTPYQASDSWATLTGNNYAFRPYFTGPMHSSQPAHYHALGVTTAERGFYQSVAIGQDEATIGVAVAKRSLTEIDAALATLSFPAALIDADGIIFATNRPQWLFHATAPHDPQQLEALRASRRYANQSLDTVDLDRTAAAMTLYGLRHRLHPTAVIDGTWTLLAMPPHSAPLDLRLLFSTSALLGILAISSGAAILFFRRQRAHLRRLLDGQDELARSREQFALAVAGSNDGIWDWDLRSSTLFLSPRWKDQLGYADHELPNVFNSFADRLHPDDREQVMDQVQGYLRGDIQKYEVELRLRHKDGSWRWLLARGQAVRDSQGQAVRMAGSHTDITERKRMEEELHQSNRNLAEQSTLADQANQAKSLFLANMSHELRTPLNGVIGMTSLLCDTVLNKDQRWFADTIRASGQQLLELINDILDLSKIEAGQLMIEERDFDLATIIDEVGMTLAPLAQAKGLELLCRVEPGTPRHLRGDARRIRQILLNLGGNAIKFTDLGEVMITAANESQDDNVIQLCLRVRDTGIGIPADQQHLLFKPFSQIDASMTRRHGGTGLGLSISHRLAELMSGTITCKSAVGAGSVFSCTIRLARQTGQQRTATTSPALLQGLRALIIDDNHSACEHLADLLKSWGLSCAIATSLESAADIMRATDGAPFRFVLIDADLASNPRRDIENLINDMNGIEDSVQVIWLVQPSTSDATRRISTLPEARTILKPCQGSAVLMALVDALRQAHVDHESTSPSDNTPSALPRLPSGRNVLLVEDNHVNRQVAATMLTRLGLTVSLAADGQEAVEYLTKHQVDLILMDCQMPGMNGYEATRHIRDPSSAVLDHIVPIIALTAHALDEDRRRCHEVGMNDHMAKPIALEQLHAMLMRWLDHQHPTSPPRDKGHHA